MKGWLEIKYHIFIPAYNECNNISEVINNIRRVSNGIPITVIDDGSDDYTGYISKLLGANVVRHKINLGGGAAIKTAFYLALKSDFDYIITLDADGQHDPNDLITFFTTIEHSLPDIIIGSRFLNGNKIIMKGYRKFGIKFFSKLFKIIYGIELTDITSCYRAYKIDFIKNSYNKLHENQYYAIEVLKILAKNKGSLIEIPVLDINRKYGNSKKGILKYFYNLLRVILSWKII